MNRTSLLACLAGLAIPAAALAGGGQIFYTWNGPAGGAWGAAGNWSPLGVPDSAGEVAVIPGGHTPVLSGGFIVDKFGIGLGATLTIANNSSLTVLAQTDGLGITGTMSNEGTLHINSGGNLTNLIISGPVGSSAVTGNAANNPSRILCSNTTANRIFGATGNERFFLEEEVTLEGSLQLGVNLLSIENRGRIRAVGDQGIFIDPNGQGCDNYFALEAATGPLFLINGLFRNFGSGGIVANSLQNVFVQNSRVEGGLLNTSISGFINIQGSTLADTRVLGNVRVQNNNLARIETAMRFMDSGSFLILDSGGNLTDAILEGDVTLRGASFNAGVVSSNSTANRIYSSSGAGRLTLADTVFIRGSMHLGINLMSLTVNDLCVVEAMGNQGLVIDPNADGVLNHGVLRAKNGSTLTLQSGSFNNAMGEIEAEFGGVVSVSASVVTGGLLEGGGPFFLQNSELNGVTSTASLHIPNNNSAFLRTGITNNATLNLDSGGNLTNLLIRGDTTLSGAGVLFGSNSTANRVYAENSADRLTNASGHTIRGSMQLGLNLMAVTNNGLIEAVGNQGLAIDANSGGFDNNSIVRAATGSSVLISGTDFDNAAGSIVVNDGASCTLSSSVVTGGLLSSSGTGFFSLVGSELQIVTSTASLHIPNNNSAFLRTGITNNATLNLDSGGNLTNLLIRGDTTLSGAGVLFGSNSTANRVYAENSADRLTNASGHTIRGSMQLGLNLMAVTNNGLIEAVGNQGLAIDANSGGFDNNSIVRAATGSSVLISGTGFDNTGGTIVAQDGASCTFSSSVITGGVLATAGSGLMSVVASELSGITSTAALVIPNNNSGFLRGTITNNATFLVNSGGNLTNLLIRGDTTLAGSGQLVCSNTTANRIYAENGADRLINGPGHTIRGSMSLGINLMALTNQGSIIADAPGGIFIDPNGNGFDNQGLLHASVGNITIDPGPLTVSAGNVIADAGRLINRTGGNWIQTGGTVLAHGEVQVVSNDYQLQGGTLGGNGLVDSSVTNSGGTLAPGASAGTLTLEGSYVQQALGTFDFEVGSTSDPALNDTLNVIAGSATLGGTIRITRLNGFVPPIGQGFTIVTTPANMRFGEFAAIDSPDFWHIVYLHNAAVAVFDGVGPGDCTADFNGDGNLDPDDLSDYITCFFTTIQFPGACPEADFNGDGNVDPDDLSDYITAFFAGC